GGKALQERLFTERNAAMAERVTELLRRGGSYFVVVGAGHLVVGNGIVARLQRQGYRVRQH
ncbi:MAG: TraB/GumN family protein, partial [Gammaproteobacteria bacterium]|nr:TraB/GumN family protein [Gammaproteobacteria bacterium]